MKKFWSNSSVPGSGGSVPEKRLLAAVLQRAVADYVGGEPELKAEAKIWLMTEEVNDAPLTFKFICEALDLDCSSLRKAIEHQATSAAALTEMAV